MGKGKRERERLSEERIEAEKRERAAATHA